MPFGGVEMIIEFDGEDKDGVHKHMEFVGDGSALPQQLVEEIPMLSLLGEVIGEGLLPNGENDQEDQNDKDGDDDKVENEEDSNDDDVCEGEDKEAAKEKIDGKENFALTPNEVYDEQKEDVEEENVNEDEKGEENDVVEPAVVKLNQDTSNNFDNINFNDEGVQSMHKGNF